MKSGGNGEPCFVGKIASSSIIVCEDESAKSIYSAGGSVNAFPFA